MISSFIDLFISKIGQVSLEENSFVVEMIYKFIELDNGFERRIVK